MHLVLNLTDTSLTDNAVCVGYERYDELSRKIKDSVNETRICVTNNEDFEHALLDYPSFVNPVVVFPDAIKHLFGVDVQQSNEADQLSRQQYFMAFIVAKGLVRTYFPTTQTQKATSLTGSSIDLAAEYDAFIKVDAHKAKMEELIRTMSAGIVLEILSEDEYAELVSQRQLISETASIRAESDAAVLAALNAKGAAVNDLRALDGDIKGQDEITAKVDKGLHALEKLTFVVGSANHPSSVRIQPSQLMTSSMNEALRHALLYIIGSQNDTEGDDVNGTKMASNGVTPAGLATLLICAILSRGKRSFLLLASGNEFQAAQMVYLFDALNQALGKEFNLFVALCSSIVSGATFDWHTYKELGIDTSLLNNTSQAGDRTNGQVIVDVFKAVKRRWADIFFSIVTMSMADIDNIADIKAIDLSADVVIELAVNTASHVLTASGRAQDDEGNPEGEPETSEHSKAKKRSGKSGGSGRGEVGA